MTGTGAIFDMDGLLVDSEPVWHEVEVAVFRRHGVPMTVQRCLETKGMFLGDAVAHWFGRYPWEGATTGEVAAEIVDAMARRLAEAVPLKPGALHALDFCLHRGARTALASSSPRRLIEVVLDRVGLREKFAVVRSAEDEAAGKPDPAIFLSTARLLGVEPGRCVVFEDSPAGVRAARAAGMACVAVPEAAPAGVATGTGTASLHEADVVLGSLADLDDGVWGRLVGAAVRPRAVRPAPGPGGRAGP